jgi:aminopeptidase N
MILAVFLLLTAIPRVGPWLDAASLETAGLESVGGWAAQIDDATKVPWPGRIPATDDRGYDVLTYDLDVTVAVVEDRLTGTAAITLRLLDPPPPALRLDLVDVMAASAVTWDDATAAFVQAGDSLMVSPPTALAAGDTVTVVVTYAGEPPRHGLFWSGLMYREYGSITPDDPTDDGPIVANVSEPYSSHSWFPCKDHPADKATLRLAATVPDTLIAVSNGVLVQESSPAPGWRRFAWATDQPIATYLVGLAVSDYVSWTEQCGTVPLQYHVFASDVAAAEVVYAPTCDMLQFLEELAGPYPFPGEKYAQCEISWIGAMENQTATVVAQAVVLDGESAHLVVVHELAHQWFGDSLTPRHWRDIWLNEGFARYCEGLWIEHTQGRAVFLDYMYRVGPGRDPNLFAGRGTLAAPNPDRLLDMLVYNKGAWVLHILRGQIGDDAFFRFLRDYATAPALAHGNVTTADLIAVASAAAGEDVEPILAPWLETDAAPKIGLAFTPRTLDGHDIRVVIEQHGKVFFPLTVPVRVYAGGVATDHRVRAHERRIEVTLPSGAPVDSVVVDPEGWLMWRTARQDPVPLSPLEVGVPRPNPAVDAVALPFRLGAAAAVQATIHDARGRRVGRWPLGEYAADTTHLWTWNGHDNSGRRVAAGVYWVTLEAASEHATRRVTVLR